MSNIATVTHSATSATLSWLPDLMLTDGRLYQVALRNITAEGNFTVMNGPLVKMHGYTSLKPSIASSVLLSIVV